MSLAEMKILPFLEVFEDVSAGNVKIKQSDYLSAGEIPIVDQGQSLIGGYSNAQDSTCKAELPVVIFGDHTRVVKYIDFPFALGADGVKVLKNRCQADVKYLYYCLKNSRIPDTGYNRHYKFLKELKIPLPPLEVQKKIAAVLEKADALRRKREEQIKRLDDLLQATFLDMFGDPVTNPKGWPVKKLLNILKDKKDLVDGPFGSSVNTKTDYIENGIIPVIRTKNVGLLFFKPEDLKFMTREKYETVKRSQVLPGDIVLTKVGTIGNLCIFPGAYKEAVLSTTGSCRIRPNREVSEPLFLLHYLYHYRPRMLEIASTGVQAFLNMDHIKNFDIFLPPYDKQNKFAKLCNSMELKADMLRKAEHEFNFLFNSLMQRAFKGELELK